MTRNRQIRLASRPVGLPTRQNWQVTDEDLGATGRRRRAREGAVPLARPGHARLDERCEVVHPAGGDRRGDARRRGRPRGGVEAPGVPGRRRGERQLRRAGVRAPARRPSQAQRPREDRPRAGQLDPVAQRARHAGHDGLLRAARRRPAEGGRDAGRRAAPRGPWARRWASSARSRACAWSASPAARPSAASSSTSSASTPASTTRPAACATASRSTARRASTCTSTTSAARSSMPCWRAWRAARAS